MTVDLAYEPTMAARPETPESAIKVNNLIKRYPGASSNAVDNISFNAQRGEIFGLLGPNGAGKTTTIGILTTSVRPTSGTVSIMGIDVARDPVGVKQCIAVMPQRSNLDLSLRPREILTFHASYHGIPRTERNARADLLLKELGLEGHSKDKARHFSGGQAQRLMLARALMHSPDVLFLDEPTNNLDPQSRLFLWDRIRALRERGMTILLTTHDMEEADRLCDRIAIMDHGRVLVLDTPANLKKLIPGGTRLELHVRELEQTDLARKANDSARSAGDFILEALRSLAGVLKVERVPSLEEGIQVYHLYAGDASRLIVPVIQVISEAGGELNNLHLAHPSLEGVFIYLTGRNLRS
jgi:ABC-2 type transport system ATP-binding protein